MPLFTTLANAVKRTGDALDIKMSTVEGGDAPTIRLVITANLGGVPKEASAKEAAMRAALSSPLVIQGTPEECEAALEQHITTYSQHLDQTQASISRMQRELAKAEKVKDTASGKKKASAGNETAAPASTADAEGQGAAAPAPATEAAVEDINDF